MAVDGRLPPWSQWWDEADVAPLFPDAETRARLTAEETRLPLDYYEQQIPVPPGWDATPCGYLLFGGLYEPVADEARRPGLAGRRAARASTCTSSSTRPASRGTSSR